MNLLLKGYLWVLNAAFAFAFLSHETCLLEAAAFTAIIFNLIFLFCEYSVERFGDKK